MEVQRDRKKVKEKEGDDVDEKSIFGHELIEDFKTESEQPGIEVLHSESKPFDDITGTIDEHRFEWLE